jgi:hypothetical protein
MDEVNGAFGDALNGKNNSAAACKYDLNSWHGALLLVLSPASSTTVTEASHTPMVSPINGECR